MNTDYTAEGRQSGNSAAALRLFFMSGMGNTFRAAQWLAAVPRAGDHPERLALSGRNRR